MNQKREAVLDTETVVAAIYLIIENAGANEYDLNEDETN